MGLLILGVAHFARLCSFCDFVGLCWVSSRVLQASMCDLCFGPGCSGKRK